LGVEVLHLQAERLLIAIAPALPTAAALHEQRIHLSQVGVLDCRYDVAFGRKLGKQGFVGFDLVVDRNTCTGRRLWRNDFGWADGGRYSRFDYVSRLAWGRAYG
jgi:hypothetical protein